MTAASESHGLIVTRHCISDDEDLNCLLVYIATMATVSKSYLIFSVTRRLLLRFSKWQTVRATISHSNKFYTE